MTTVSKNVYCFLSCYQIKKSCYSEGIVAQMMAKIWRLYQLPNLPITSCGDFVHVIQLSDISSVKLHRISLRFQKGNTANIESIICIL